MARERMVTRTVIRSDYEVMTVDTTTAQVEVTKLSLGGTIDDNTQALKQLKKVYETDTLKVVNISGVTIKEVLYGMSEIDFIAHAQILPPRGIKEEE